MNEENKNIENNGSDQPSQPQVNEKIKYILIAIAAVLVVVAAVLVLFFSNDDNSSNSSDNGSTNVTEQQNTQSESGSDTSEDQQSGQEAQEPEKTCTPVFMYFVSKSDEGYNEYMSMIEELKAEYSDKVTFDIVDVDEEPESKQNFPVEGNTPMLIMTNTSNDISALEFKCSDKARLAEDIEKSLGSQQ